MRAGRKENSTGSLSGRLTGRQHRKGSHACPFFIHSSPVGHSEGTVLRECREPSGPSVSRKGHLSDLPQGVLLDNVGVLSPWEMWGRRRIETGQWGSAQAPGKGRCCRAERVGELQEQRAVRGNPDSRCSCRGRSNGRHAGILDSGPSSHHTTVVSAPALP